MSKSPLPQAQMGTLVPSTHHGHVCKWPSPTSVSRLAITPSKRLDDDDVQFISCKPVKRRKISEQKPSSTLQQHNGPMISTAPIHIQPSPTSITTEPRESDRRVSTGMVGLPSDFNPMELTCAFRGVSLPVLEKFVLNQPFRKPRPLSPPELSPKQLPQTVAPSMLSIGTNDDRPGVPGFHTAPIAYMTANEDSVRPETATPNSPHPSSAVNQLHILNTPVTQVRSSSPVPAEPPMEVGLKGPAMPPPPLPNAGVSAAAEPAHNSSPLSDNPTRPHVTKQPCQICFRMRQQANFTKTQGFPMMHHSMPHHMIPQMACHQPYGQHFHPQMMAMAPNNMHAFSAGYGPMIVPVNSNNFAALPSHMSSPMQQTDQQSTGLNPQPTAENSGDQPQSLPTPATSATNSPTISNPTKPPASLIQPTYRKPSPNLIVDVAETCQEKFPFEEVAKRHNVPIEKVFDVFAAIIQVPLLRCPTDRRRAGKLATTRVKEYTKAKKDIQEARGQSNSGSKEETVVRPSDVAHRLGQVDLPEGFDPRGS
ncbi:hypothetical protein AAE478_001777 [Parahypoxylon ruwenzoriense]